MSAVPGIINTIGAIYGASRTGELANGELFKQLVDQNLVSATELATRAPVGKAGKKHSLAQRKLRWYQQDLRRLNLIERNKDKRGVWRLTGEGRRQFVRPALKKVLLAFSTHLGVALWGTCEDVFAGMDSTVNLALISPPYPPAKARAYDNVGPHEYVDFICRGVEPIVRALRRGGCLALNVSQDIFEPGTPARSTYLERMVIAMCDRLGLHLVERIVWHNPSKPPGPMQWASLKRVALNVAWEPVYLFTTDPLSLRTDNRRVLQAHSPRQQQLISQGGEQRTRSYSDGAYKLRAGRSFSGETEGSIPRNVVRIGHACSGQQRYKAAARALGLPEHGAPMPEALAEFIIGFATEEGDLVVDGYAGSCTTAAVCERMNRRWMVSEILGEYLRGGAERFTDAPGFSLHRDLLQGLAQRHDHPTMEGQLSFALG